MPIIIPGNRLASTGHTISQSIRFNPDDSPYMSRTFGTATDANKWTLSAWSKVAQSGNGMRFLEAGGSAGSEDFVGFGGSSGYEKLYFWKRTSSSYNYNLTSTQFFRDHSAWYHFVYVFDSSNTVSTDRMKAYVNGQRITDFSTETYPSSGLASRINTAVEHRIGEPVYGGGHSDGYVAEMVFLDGQAYDPSFFGEFNDSGIWIPKDVSGLTFGNNGFYLKGADSSALGTDSSGNGNNFTTSGLAADDKKTDTPTNNHATWNPLTGSAQVYSNGNLNAATASAAWKGGLTTAQVPLNSGTWYYEVYVDSAGSSSGQFSVGWSESNRSMSDDNSSGDTEGWVTYALNGLYYANGGTGSYGATYTTGDVIGCKINTDTSSNNVEWYKNGASQGTRSQAFNTGGTGFISPYILLYGTRNGTARFAQAEWTQTPSGITEDNAINTTNLGS
jgi:hypothetical protein